MEGLEPFESIYEITEALILRYGALGIAAAMFSESAGVPFASAIVLISAGSMILRGTLSFWTILLASALGITAGSILSYMLGLLGSVVGKKVRTNLFNPANHPAENRQEQENKAGGRLRQLWNKYGNFSIFMAQLWGVTRTFASFPAGAMHMNFYLFVLYTFLGGTLYSLAAIAVSLALTGTMGVALRLLKNLANLSPWLLLIALLAVFALACLIYLKINRSRAKD